MVYFFLLYSPQVALFKTVTVRILNKHFFLAVYQTVADNIREIGSYECGDRVTEAFEQIEELIASGDDETLVEEFGICRPFNIS